MKRILAVILSIMCIFSLAGCKMGEKITTLELDEFKQIMESYDLKIVDCKTESTDERYKEIYAAADEGHYKFEYYLLDNSSNADNIYKQCVEQLKEEYADDETNIKFEKDTNKQVGESEGTKSVFKLTTSKYYFSLLRRNNSFIYGMANIGYKDNLKEIEKQLE